MNTGLSIDFAQKALEAAALQASNSQNPLPKKRSIAALVGFMINSDFSLEGIASTVGATVDHIKWLVRETGDPAFFSVWVGGCEVNDFLVTLDKAVELEEEYKKDLYEDVAMCSYLPRN
jgi:hypothetical protein